MLRIKKNIAIVCLACMLLLATAAGAATQGTVNISFDLERIGAIASNQYAVWIEDNNGKYIRTLSATRFAATGGLAKRPATLPTWAKASDWTNNPKDVDAVSTATPGSGSLTVVWDCKDDSGQAVPAGTYVYKVEGNNFWENGFIWSGTIVVGQGAASSAATVQYLPDQAKATEKGMLVTNVKASYK
ncbi:MAG: DUF2271 domain-containing protein [Negativicutes bacterium]|nr:DUF2271 domain-containing protein [Negativicutes bacterium]